MKIKWRTPDVNGNGIEIVFMAGQPASIDFCPADFYNVRAEGDVLVVGAVQIKFPSPACAVLAANAIRLDKGLKNDADEAVRSERKRIKNLIGD